MNTFLRAILTTILSVLLAGFGLCGAYGTFGGVSSMFGGMREGKAFAGLFIACGLIGLGIAWLCWKAIARIWRKPAPPTA